MLESRWRRDDAGQSGRRRLAGSGRGQGIGLELRGDEAARSEEALAAVGLAERAGQRVSRLSAGEQTRVQVARAIASRPELLLAVEPTARLDQANALAVVNLLARLARETGAAVVCATHDPVVIEHADAELGLAGATIET